VRPVHSSVIYINGEFLPEEQAKVSVLDRCFLYGDGVFDATWVYEGVPFQIHQHIDRFFRSMKYTNIECPISKNELLTAVLQTLDKNNVTGECYIRMQISRGVGLGVRTRKFERLNLVITPMLDTATWDRERSNVADTKGLKAIVCSTRRIPPVCIDPRIKSCNYLNQILGGIEALSAGYDNGIMLDIRGFVAEGVAENVFAASGKKVATPNQVNILEGGTRETLLRLAKNANFEVQIRDMTVYDLYTAEEVFLTGSSYGIAPIVEIDGRKIGDGVPGPVFRDLKHLFLQEVNNYVHSFKAGKIKWDSYRK
jgi:branched-chain amino acid aminotransferase